MKSYTSYLFLTIISFSSALLHGAEAPAPKSEQHHSPLLWVKSELDADSSVRATRVKIWIQSPDGSFIERVICPEQVLYLGTLDNLQDASLSFFSYGKVKGCALDAPLRITAQELKQEMQEKCTEAKPDLVLYIQWDKESKTPSSTYTGYKIKYTGIGTPEKHFKYLYEKDTQKCILSHFFAVCAKNLDKPEIVKMMHQPGTRSDDKLISANTLGEWAWQRWQHMYELDVLQNTKIDLYRYILNLPDSYDKLSLDAAYQTLVQEWTSSSVEIEDNERREIVALLRKAHTALDKWRDNIVIQEPRKHTDVAIEIRLAKAD